ncbi:hypothetical protein A2U01_0082748, partial [Trifolium medium]|nr:hypothetical protein [Trifolium medium]
VERVVVQEDLRGGGENLVGSVSVIELVEVVGRLIEVAGEVEGRWLRVGKREAEGKRPREMEGRWLRVGKWRRLRVEQTETEGQWL